MFLELKNLTYKINNNTIINNVNLKLEKNGLAVIRGKSGSGKTTLLHLIGRIIKPTSGEIILDGKSYENPTNKCDTVYQNDITFVFQGFHLIDDLTCMANLLILGIEKDKAIEVLEELELDDCINKKVKLMSGGQKQRLAIARAILMDTKIILADEPTSSIDDKTRIIVEKMLLKVSKEKLVIVITHDQNAFIKDANINISIDDGQVYCGKFKSNNFKNQIKFNKQYSIVAMLTYLKTDLIQRYGRILTTICSLQIPILIILLLFGIIGGISNYVEKIKDDSFEKNIIYIQRNSVNGFSDNDINYIKSLDKVEKVDYVMVPIGLTSDANYEIKQLPKIIDGNYIGDLPFDGTVLVSYDLKDLTEVTLNKDGVVKQYAISGYLADALTTNTVYLNDDSLEFYETPTLAVVCENYHDAIEVINVLNKDILYSINNDFYYFEQNFIAVIDLLMMGLMFFAFVTITIAGILIYMMQYASYIQKQKELVTLYLFGVKKHIIGFMYMIQAITLGLLSILVGTIIFSSLLSLLNIGIEKLFSVTIIRIVMPLNQTFAYDSKLFFFPYFLLIMVVSLVMGVSTLIALIRVFKKDYSVVLREDDIC